MNRKKRNTVKKYTLCYSWTDRGSLGEQIIIRPYHFNDESYFISDYYMHEEVIIFKSLEEAIKSIKDNGLSKDILKFKFLNFVEQTLANIYVRRYL